MHYKPLGFGLGILEIEITYDISDYNIFNMETPISIN